MLLLLALACGPKLPPPTAWVPPHPNGAVSCGLPPPAPPVGAPPGVWYTALYVDRDGVPGGELMIRVYPGLTWDASEQSAPGLYDRVVAKGTMENSGVLLGLPPALIVGTRGITRMGGDCTIGGMPIP